MLTSREVIESRRGPHARFIVSSLLISRSIRRDSIACLYLKEGLAVMFYGSKIRHLRADESSAFGIIRKALRKLSVRNPHPGVYIHRTDLCSVIRHLGTESIVMMRDDKLGLPIDRALCSLSGKFSLAYITSIDSVHVDSSALRLFKPRFVKFPRPLSPEQEVAIVNIMLDQLTL